jgi:predicted dithiol-disulfide oxidoreductase (DUF899 family)
MMEKDSIIVYQVLGSPGADRRCYSADVYVDKPLAGALQLSSL